MAPPAFPTESDLHALLQRQRLATIGRPVTAATRKDRLRRAIDLLVTHEAALTDAMVEDFGIRSRDQSRLYDIVASLGPLKHAAAHVDRWMKPERRKVDPMLGLMGASAWIEHQPKGVVGILSPWNFPLFLTFTPLAGVLAAGNSALIKPSEHTPRTSALLAELVEAGFDEEELRVVTGDAEVAAAFTRLPFDHIIYTGSTSVGRHVMRAAAENLTPLTLELGGKSPVIVGQGPNLKLMANRLITGKLLNAGQICLAPDYVLVPRSELPTLIAALTEAAKTLYPDLDANPDYGAVLGDRNRGRILAYVDEARASGAEVVQIGGASEGGRLPFFIIRDCPPDLAVMSDEIFGPILPVIGYDSLDEAIAFVNARPRPLGLYFFGSDKGEERAVLERTVSGGVTLNDVVFHVTVEDLPFGGVGASGFGVYHGLEGFKAVSHPKPIFRQSRLDVAGIAGLAPPYGDKLRAYIAKHLSR
ncbi:coniferyl aldehyde dehydrogenase [soil metagenome]